MAAFALAAAMIGVNTPRSVASEPAPIKQKVQLILRFDGLSSKGGEVEIRPGHAGCKFETIKFQTKGHPRMTVNGSMMTIMLDPMEVETMSADGNCSISIVLKETGQPDKTVRRTIRLTPAPQGKAAKPVTMTYYISSNSINPVASRPASDTKKKQ
jgi:hypothetical protein